MGGTEEVSEFRGLDWDDAEKEVAYGHEGAFCLSPGRMNRAWLQP